MKKILVSFVMLFSILSAEQKAVFDCAAGDMKFVLTRMKLIDMTAKELKQKNIPYDFVLTIHSKCTPIVNKKSDNKDIKAIHQKLTQLKREHNVKIEACKIATNKFGYKKDDIISEADIVKNSITRVIQLQNSGYALIPYH
ncbi:DsrE family protein [Sulfurimonas lithotrophica]|uniref:DsrE family protein n=1 Tax=Sulfurimonas lithotrophica TaxID=2590022 RepID=A0A5P8P0I6_9BACT|nr:DsrE family protein [Sulfurimonas lithotrophica]QFR49087.1 DsrE family protein [Sulfurimonas lithotrophica]